MTEKQLSDLKKYAKDIEKMAIRVGGINDAVHSPYLFDIEVELKNITTYFADFFCALAREGQP